MKEQIESLIQAQLEPQSLEVQIDGNHGTLRVVSSQFEGLNKVKRQQLVYACINDLIASGTLHAVNIQAISPSEQ